MEEERTTRLHAWASQGATLVSDFLIERASILRVAAGERDALQAELSTLSSTLSSLRDQLSSTTDALSRSRLSNAASQIALSSCMRAREAAEARTRAAKEALVELQKRCEGVEAECEEMRVEGREREGRIEGLMAAWQESLQKEARVRCEGEEKVRGLEAEVRRAREEAQRERDKVRQVGGRAEEAEAAVKALFERMRGVLRETEEKREEKEEGESEGGDEGCAEGQKERERHKVRGLGRASGVEEKEVGVGGIVKKRPRRGRRKVNYSDSLRVVKAMCAKSEVQ